MSSLMKQNVTELQVLWISYDVCIFLVNWTIFSPNLPRNFPPNAQFALSLSLNCPLPPLKGTKLSLASTESDLATNHSNLFHKQKIDMSKRFVKCSMLSIEP